MISRSRSGPTVAAMSIECTTSANSTVTCLYSADRLTSVTGAPHSLQNLEFGGSSVPHDLHGSPAAVSAPRLLSSTSVSCHRWSTMSVKSLCHLRYEVLRLSYVVYSETAFAGGTRTGASDPEQTRYKDSEVKYSCLIPGAVPILKRLFKQGSMIADMCRLGVRAIVLGASMGG